MVLRLPDSWSNWNLEMLVFEEKGKPEYPEKNLSEQWREPITNSTHIWRRRQRRRRDLKLGHIGGRRVLSPLRHLCSLSQGSYYNIWEFDWLLHHMVAWNQLQKAKAALSPHRTQLPIGSLRSRIFFFRIFPH